MKTLYLSIMLILVAAISVQTSTVSAISACPTHIATKIDDPDYIKKAVQVARGNPDFTSSTKNENYTYYAIYGHGQYDDTNCNNFFWSETDVVFSDNITNGTTHYLIVMERPDLSSSFAVGNYDDGSSAVFNDSFTGTLTNEQFIENNHDTTFGADYPPRLDATPLKQTEAGIFPSNVECKDNFELMIKDHRGYCVRPSSISRLEANGWQYIQTYNIPHDFDWCKDYTASISDGKVVLTCIRTSGGIFDLPSPKYIMKPCPGSYGCSNSLWYEQSVPKDLLTQAQKEKVIDASLTAFGVNKNDTKWNLDRFLVFASSNQWFSDVQLFVSNGTSNCGRYLQSEINLQDLQTMFTFDTDPIFSVCKKEHL